MQNEECRTKNEEVEATRSRLSFQDSRLQFPSSPRSSAFQFGVGVAIYRAAGVRIR